MGRAIPVHLLLGTLGAGKTTTVVELLRRVPAAERWAVLVNEFGAVGLDGAFIRESGGEKGRIVVREAPGGCICCSAQGELEEGIRALVEEERPDRILIEPTGLADADALVRQLREQGPRWGIRLQSVIGHIDVRLARNPGVFGLPFWQSLLSLSDDIIGTRTDKAPAARVEGFVRAVAANAPGLRSIHLGRENFLATDWQEDPRRGIDGFRPLQGGVLDLSSGRHAHETAVIRREAFLDGAGTCFEAVGKIHYTLGWIVAPSTHIRMRCLERWLEGLRNRPFPPMRLKGILHTDEGWIRVQMVNTDEPVYATANPREDSRMELIAGADSSGWREFERLWLKNPVVPLVADNLYKAP